MALTKIKGTALADIIAGTTLQELIQAGDGDDVISGGAGNDTFVFFKSDVVGTAGPLGVDHITDFSTGSMVSVKTTAGFVDVVALDGVHGQSTADLLSAGMLLT